VGSRASGPAPVQLRSLSVTANYFDVFGIHAALGRLVSQDDQAPGHSPVALLGHAVWTSQFGADPGVIGRIVRLRGESFTVIGVLPEGGTADWSYTEVWVPLILEPDTLNRTYRSLTIYGKLKPSIAIESALANMTTIEARLAQSYPVSNKGWSVAVVPYAEWLVSKPLRQSLYVLFGPVVVVLLIGCVNLAGIALARGAAREREVAVRAALGGSRRRLLQQFLIEHVVLSCGGGIVGLGVGYAAMAALRAWLPAHGTPGQIPPGATVTLDGRVLAFTLAISVGSGMLFGLIPALNATHLDLAAAIKEGGCHGGSSSRHFALRRGFVRGGGGPGVRPALGRRSARSELDLTSTDQHGLRPDERDDGDGAPLGERRVQSPGRAKSLLCDGGSDEEDPCRERWI
jgi:putative ABC transport system permease protein